MLRKFLLPAAALMVLGGCATGYGYRSGNGGDYYYGQPRVEYSQPYGGFGVYGYGGSYGYGYGSSYYGGMRPIAYYDQFGRLLYGYPQGYGSYGYYGAPVRGYPYGYPYAPRPPRGDGHHHPRPDPDQHGDRNDRKPPWRDFGGLRPRQDLPAGASVVRPQRQDGLERMGPAPRPMRAESTAPRVESRREGVRAERPARTPVRTERRDQE